MSFKRLSFKTLALTGLSACAMSATLASACPPGFYSIGGQGVSGCAPIPGYNQGGYTAPAAQVSYIDKPSAAVALSSNNILGYGASKMFDPQKKAIRDCEEKGGINCKIHFSYGGPGSNGQCATVGEGNNDRIGKGYFFQVTGTDHNWGRKKFGRQSVINQCLKDGYQAEQCKVVYEHCTSII